MNTRPDQGGPMEKDMVTKIIYYGNETSQTKAT